MIIKGDIAKLANSLEVGMYQQAASEGLTFDKFLAQHAAKPEGGSIENPYAGMSRMQRYMAQKSFEQQAVLTGEIAPPSLAGMLLKHFDLVIDGSRNDTVEKAFATPQSSTLFPYMISETLYKASMDQSKWQMFVGETTNIEGTTMKKVIAQDTEVDRQASKGGLRGSGFRQIILKLGENDIHLSAHGFDLLVDYMTMKQAPMNLYLKELERLVQQLGVDETNDAINVAVNGDGNTGTGLQSAQQISVKTSGSIAKKDMISFAAAMPERFDNDVYIGSTLKVVDAWDALSDLTDPKNQLGQVGVPMPSAIRWDKDHFAVGGAGEFTLLGFNKANGIGAITNDEMSMTEVENIVAKRSTLTAVTKYTGFHNIDDEALCELDVVS